MLHWPQVESRYQTAGNSINPVSRDKDKVEKKLGIAKARKSQCLRGEKVGSGEQISYSTRAGQNKTKNAKSVHETNDAIVNESE